MQYIAIPKHPTTSEDKIIQQALLLLNLYYIQATLLHGIWNYKKIDKIYKKQLIVETVVWAEQKCTAQFVCNANFWEY